MKRKQYLLLVVLTIVVGLVSTYGIVSAQETEKEQGLDKKANGTTVMMESIAKILDALAWPLVILIVVVLLRKKVLERLLDRLESFAYKGTLAKFKENVSDVSETLRKGEEWEESTMEEKDLPEPDEEVAKSTESEESRPIKSPFVSLVNDGRLIHTMEYKYLEIILQHSPRDAVIAAWYHAENALVSLAIAVGIDDAENEHYANILQMLANMNLISNNTIKLYSEFNNLRDSAVVTRNFNEVMNEAGPERYIGTTLRLAANLQEAEERARKRS